MTDRNTKIRQVRGAIRWWWLALLGLLAVTLAIVSSQTCIRTGLSKGVWLRECPDGDLHQTIAVNSGGLTRGGNSYVYVSASSLYTSGASDAQRSEPLRSFTPEVALVNGSTVTPLSPLDGWKKSGTSLVAQVTLPKVNDGDYTLRTTVTSAIETSSLDLALPLFTPARVHVITDRPLYQPGNTVKFRALALKASDLTPLDERPGRWTVQDPSGEVLLEEKAPTASWGVASGSFPLDVGATSGEWRVTWTSGGTSETRGFTVKPFTLPRFRIEASAAKPFYRRHERPVLKGTVQYSSGAPVPNAKVSLSWNFSGNWPPPTAWAEGAAMPKLATSNANGAFTVELPAVPDDLTGQFTISASMAAVDKAGDRVEGSASVLLSEDLIAVTAVTELEAGLVEGFNNRLFLRSTTADGRVLDGVTLNVKRLWEATDRGTDAQVDEDGVASLQVDPGPAVNVIIPALPFRPPAKAKLVTRDALTNLLAGEDEDGDVTLGDRITFDKLDARFEPCVRFVRSSGEQQTVGLLVHASGAQGPVSLPPGKVGECMGQALKELRFEPGHERFFQAQWSFDDSDLPNFEVTPQGIPDVPSMLEERLQVATVNARDCLPATVKSGAFPRLLQWKVDGDKVDVTWVPVKGDSFDESAISCVTSRVKSFTLPHAQSDETGDEAKASQVGVAHLRVNAPAKYEAARPQDTVMVGYEFLVTAKKDNEVLGSTRLRMSPGAVPQIRLRASQQLVDPGATVVVEILRGPDFTGELPEDLYLQHAFEHEKAKVDKEARKATFTVPSDWQGWASVEWNGAQVFFFVRSKTPVTVGVTAEKSRYAPGQVAHLGIETKIGGQAGQAAVGLFGVDESLGQLVALPGADELSHLRAQPSATASFGGIDAEALSLGRVRGANAAAATLLRVAALPPPPQVEASVAVNGLTQFDANAVLVDRFYVVLGELSTQVREWEASAPASELMSNATMATLWNNSLTAIERRQDSARDAWGRTLRLHRLPGDLLALTEPRTLVINAKRLPEDIQNWSQWVAKEKP